MDRKWVNADRLSKEYKNGVKEFCKHVAKHVRDRRFILCPCKKCLNIVEVDGLDKLEEHLVCEGIDKTYTCWTYHGEKKGERRASNLNSNYHFADKVDTNIFRDIKGSSFSDKNEIPNVFNEEELRDHPDMHEKLKDDAVYHCGRVAPSFPNYRLKEYAEFDECPKCSLKRYKSGNSPAKVMWYFPLLPRLRRLYASAEDAKNLIWHHDARINDGLFRHPSDSPQWKIFDDTYKDFGKEPRNLRLALSTDGMNPHRLQSSSHSTWPREGYYACPICSDGTDHIRLKNCKKCVYMGHRLVVGTKPSVQKYAFSIQREVEERRAPPIPSGGDKNVFDSLVGTLLGVKGTTKDGLNARMDMMEMGIRNELGPWRSHGKQPYLPAAAHNSRLEMRRECYYKHSFYQGSRRILIEHHESCSLSDMKLKDCGEGVTGGQQFEIDRTQWHRAHICVLHNTIDVVPFVHLHKQIISEEHPRKGANWIELEHNRTFVDWFKTYVVNELIENNESIPDRVKWLSRGPDPFVYSYKCYLINGYSFYTREHDARSTMQNSGVSITATALH
ncbi:uncharacterized protein LOC141673635 [Apium graveolens]|uniref:uncharacterized protein LOC141673635 n=1 Tax=Apium graveolens TaxID=4045 RepID=UPI003D7A54D8